MSEKLQETIHTIVREAMAKTIEFLRARFGWSEEVRVGVGDAFLVGAAMLHIPPIGVNSTAVAQFARYSYVGATAHDTAPATIDEATAVILTIAAIGTLMRDGGHNAKRAVERVTLAATLAAEQFCDGDCAACSDYEADDETGAVGPN